MTAAYDNRQNEQIANRHRRQQCHYMIKLMKRVRYEESISIDVD